MEFFFIIGTLVVSHIIAWKYGFRAGLNRGVELTKFNRDTYSVD